MVCKKIDELRWIENQPSPDMPSDSAPYCLHLWFLAALCWFVCLVDEYVCISFVNCFFCKSHFQNVHLISGTIFQNVENMCIPLECFTCLPVQQANMQVHRLLTNFSKHKTDTDDGNIPPVFGVITFTLHRIWQDNLNLLIPFLAHKEGQKC